MKKNVPCSHWHFKQRRITRVHSKSSTSELYGHFVATTRGEVTAKGVSKYKNCTGESNDEYLEMASPTLNVRHQRSYSPLIPWKWRDLDCQLWWCFPSDFWSRRVYPRELSSLQQVQLLWGTQVCCTFSLQNWPLLLEWEWEEVTEAEYWTLWSTFGPEHASLEQKQTCCSKYKLLVLAEWAWAPMAGWVGEGNPWGGVKVISEGELWQQGFPARTWGCSQ